MLESTTVPFGIAPRRSNPWLLQDTFICTRPEWTPRNPPSKGPLPSWFGSIPQYSALATISSGSLNLDDTPSPAGKSAGDSIFEGCGVMACTFRIDGEVSDRV